MISESGTYTEDFNGGSVDSVVVSDVVCDFPAYGTPIGVYAANPSGSGLTGSSPTGGPGAYQSFWQFNAASVPRPPEATYPIVFMAYWTSLTTEQQEATGMNAIEAQAYFSSALGGEDPAADAIGGAMGFGLPVITRIEMDYCVVIGVGDPLGGDSTGINTAIPGSSGGAVQINFATSNWEFYDSSIDTTSVLGPAVSGEWKHCVLTESTASFGSWALNGTLRQLPGYVDFRLHFAQTLNIPFDGFFAARRTFIDNIEVDITITPWPGAQPTIIDGLFEGNRVRFTRRS